MPGSTITWLKSAGLAFGLVVVFGVISNVVFGEEEGGWSDVVHFSGMFFLLVTVVCLVAALAAALVRPRVRG